MRGVAPAVVALPILIGCTSTTLQVYEGPARPDSETALVSAERPGNNNSDAEIRITSVDTTLGDSVPVMTRAIRTLPREICLGVRAYSSSVRPTTSELCFEAFAGGRYELRAQTEAQPIENFPQDQDRDAGAQRGTYNVYRILILDTATSEIVADTQR